MENILSADLEDVAIADLKVLRDRINTVLEEYDAESVPQEKK